jgi:hypothetical protein
VELDGVAHLTGAALDLGLVPLETADDGDVHGATVPLLGQKQT